MSSLADFLTGIADALRERNGTSEQINAQEFVAEIEKTTDRERALINGRYIPKYPLNIEAGDFEGTSLANSQFYGQQNLNKVVVPDTITSLGTYSFYNCMSLPNVNRPDAMYSIGIGVTSIPAACFGWNTLTELFEFKGDITEIAAQSFNNCVQSYGPSTRTITFLGCTSVPTLANSNAFTGGSNSVGKGIIVVPDNLYDEWIVATNWSAVVSAGSWVFKKESEYLAETANIEEE